MTRGRREEALLVRKPFLVGHLLHLCLSRIVSKPKLLVWISKNDDLPRHHITQGKREFHAVIAKKQQVICTTVVESHILLSLPYCS